MNADMIWQIIRYALLAVGGYFTNKGVITGDQLTAIIGGLGTIFTAAWGIYIKYGTTSVPDATAARADVPTVSAITGTVKK